MTRTAALIATLAWPAERVPDATILAGHHYWTGLMVAMYAVWHVQDDHPHREPSIVMGGVLTAVLGFLLWPHHPIAGATISHVGTLAIGAAVLIGDFMARYRWVHWKDLEVLPIAIPYRPGFRGVVVIGWLITLDDLMSHAWGVWTPLDGWLWAQVILPRLWWLRDVLAV